MMRPRIPLWQRRLATPGISEKSGMKARGLLDTPRGPPPRNTPYDRPPVRQQGMGKEGPQAQLNVLSMISKAQQELQRQRERILMDMKSDNPNLDMSRLPGTLGEGGGGKQSLLGEHPFNGPQGGPRGQAVIGPHMNKPFGPGSSGPRFDGPSARPGGQVGPGPRMPGVGPRGPMGGMNGSMGGPSGMNGPMGGPSGMNGPMGGPSGMNRQGGGPGMNGPMDGPPGMNGPAGMNRQGGGMLGSGPKGPMGGMNDGPKMGGGPRSSVTGSGGMGFGPSNNMGPGPRGRGGPTGNAGSGGFNGPMGPLSGPGLLGNGPSGPMGNTGQMGRGGLAGPGGMDSSWKGQSQFDRLNNFEGSGAGPLRDSFNNPQGSTFQNPPSQSQNRNWNQQSNTRSNWQTMNSQGPVGGWGNSPVNGPGRSGNFSGPWAQQNKSVAYNRNQRSYF